MTSVEPSAKLADAVRLFQSEQGLPVDGVFGPKTARRYAAVDGSQLFPGAKGLVLFQHGRLIQKLSPEELLATASYAMEVVPDSGFTIDSLMGLFYSESRGNAAATSPTGHVGLCQLGPSAVTDVFHRLADPTFNGLIAYRKVGRGLVMPVDHYDPVVSAVLALAYLRVLRNGWRYETIEASDFHLYLAYVFGYNKVPQALLEGRVTGRIGEVNAAVSVLQARFTAGASILLA